MSLKAFKFGLHVCSISGSTLTGCNYSSERLGPLSVAIVQEINGCPCRKLKQDSTADVTRPELVCRDGNAEPGRTCHRDNAEEATPFFAVHESGSDPKPASIRRRC